MESNKTLEEHKKDMLQAQLDHTPGVDWGAEHMDSLRYNIKYCLRFPLKDMPLWVNRHGYLEVLARYRLKHGI